MTDDQKAREGLVEKVARAICRAFYATDDLQSRALSVVVSRNWERFVREAEAAIDAIPNAAHIATLEARVKELEGETERTAAVLKDPTAVRLNTLRGTIAQDPEIDRLQSEVTRLTAALSDALKAMIVVCDTLRLSPTTQGFVFDGTGAVLTGAINATTAALASTQPKGDDK